MTKIYRYFPNNIYANNSFMTNPTDFITPNTELLTFEQLGKYIDIDSTVSKNYRYSHSSNFNFVISIFFFVGNDKHLFY